LPVVLLSPSLALAGWVVFGQEPTSEEEYRDISIHSKVRNEITFSNSKMSVTLQVIQPVVVQSVNEIYRLYFISLPSEKSTQNIILLQ
jgi:hypothetical protein